ncbi:phosphoribosyltransferase [Leptolyngbya sp. FACHB-671]|uniref:phosphoribosyltransferase n=1 Tax=Leptolyngbya sp. FACHB-671 TaxID=2692812 RepID=UPI0016833FED|nr:phosphoribosyltransferase [Leptolyngbya sp. FACHB-671]MBD2068279.1 phosphoribosyltransferase [Leptolyngbya sp. FACHB-671]
MLFKDRTAAGQLLAEQLKEYVDRSDVLVLALPRGGVPVAFEIAKALNAPLDVWLVRKLGVPGQEELAMGAIASGGVRVLNPDVVRNHRLFEAAIHKTTVREQRELERREKLYRGDRPPLNLHGATVIVVDDGLATGATMRAAIMAIRHQDPARLVVAIPVAAAETCHDMEAEVDQVVCAMTPEPFYSVGLWYESFPQVSDAEVGNLLKLKCAVGSTKS